MRGQTPEADLLLRSGMQRRPGGWESGSSVAAAARGGAPHPACRCRGRGTRAQQAKLATHPTGWLAGRPEAAAAAHVVAGGGGGDARINAVPCAAVRLYARQRPASVHCAIVRCCCLLLGKGKGGRRSLAAGRAPCGKACW